MTCDHQTTAANYLKKAIEWSQTANPIIEFNLALVMAEQGQFGDAETLLRKLLKHSPFFEPAWQLLVIVQFPRTDSPSRWHCSRWRATRWATRCVCGTFRVD